MGGRPITGERRERPGVEPKHRRELLQHGGFEMPGAQPVQFGQRNPRARDHFAIGQLQTALGLCDDIRRGIFQSNRHFRSKIEPPPDVERR